MAKFHFKCTTCNAEYTGEEVIYLCPGCSRENKPGLPPKGVLKTIYDYYEIRDRFPKGALFQGLCDEKFLSLLPINGFESWPMLRVGGTPMYRLDKQTSGPCHCEERSDVAKADLVIARSEATWQRLTGFGFEIYLKDDSQNPTFSFKDRASALVSAWAKENGIDTIVAASTGNAGSSLAGICANQGQKAIIVVPESAPIAKLTQILMYGATLIPVKGTYDDAFDLSVGISREYGYYNRNTAFNPLTIEGKKTAAFEIFEQLGQVVPDRIFIPAGDGVIYAGVAKGFEDLLVLGIIDRMPVLVAVQAEGSSNLIRNIGKQDFQSRPSATIADSISVDIPRNFYMAADFYKKYQGESLSVTDEEILEALVQLARTTGIFSEPAAAAAYAGILKYEETGMIPTGSKNVVLLTGSGLKDLGAVQSTINTPEPVGSDFSSIKHFITKTK
jgi:threonine synthase